MERNPAQRLVEFYLVIVAGPLLGRVKPPWPAVGHDNPGRLGLLQQAHESLAALVIGCLGVTLFILAIEEPIPRICETKSDGRIATAGRGIQAIIRLAGIGGLCSRFDP
jgi:hypothetical protein